MFESKVAVLIHTWHPSMRGQTGSMFTRLFYHSLLHCYRILHSSPIFPIIFYPSSPTSQLYFYHPIKFLEYSKFRYSNLLYFPGAWPSDSSLYLLHQSEWSTPSFNTSSSTPTSSTSYMPISSSPYHKKTFVSRSLHPTPKIPKHDPREHSYISSPLNLIFPLHSKWLLRCILLLLLISPTPLPPLPPNTRGSQSGGKWYFPGVME